MSASLHEQFSKYKSQLIYELAFLNVDFVGPKTFFYCLENFLSIRNVFDSPISALEQAGLKQKSIEQIKAFSGKNLESELNSPETFLGKRVKANLDWAKQAQHHIISYTEAAYPQALKNIHNFPPYLFVIGNQCILNQQQIAIVGSRKASKAGLLFAKDIASQLVQYNLVVTSGLAQGIDAAAHDGALMIKDESTIAILAHGLDGIYPAKNKNLAENILKNGGALVSEFPVGINPKPEFFPRRNRIISGMSLGVLVVEAEVKSGSLVTAYCALEQGREVFAVPGAINNPYSKGCHQLIKQGAKLVEGLEDVLEDLPCSFKQTKEKVKPQKQQELNKYVLTELTALEKELVFVLKSQNKTINELVEVLKYSTADIAASLTMLELKQIIIASEQGYELHPQIFK